ncbi:discoidin domain-containing protein [Methylobacterium sp. Leaf99]|uniref:discoidin domain-containing protein n=1 Tax=Methylobacterium sp. Leaf99 TaxID=1736251 RepID=UPI000B0E4A6E|nr:discoidin domain-containing protein [Methylobacterium sp. Leaf99]
MSAGLFFNDVPYRTGAPRDYGFGAQPGENGRAGNGIRSIEQIPNTYELLVALDDGRALIFPLPAGPVGQDGTTPEFITGNVTYGTRDTLPQLVLRRLAHGLFAVDLTLPDLTAATASAAAALASEQSAAASKTAAAGSATAAAASAIQADQKSALAAGAATDAIAAYDSFDDRYLGARAADPALDNDGNALLVGALYFNSVTKKMRVWDGVDWQVAYAQITGGVQSFKGRDGSVLPMAGDYAVADVTGLPAALGLKLEAGSSIIVSMQATISGLRKDLLLTELLVAEAKGDRVNMSAGIVDPYGDTSDFTFADAIFNTTSKVLSFAPAKAYEARTFGSFTSNGTFTGTGTTAYNVDSQSNNSAALDQIFNGGAKNYMTGEPNYWIQALFSGAPIRSVEIQFFISNGFSQSFSIADADSGTILGSINVPNSGVNGLYRALVPLSASATKGIRITFGANSGGLPQIRQVRGYGSRATDQIAATITGYGRSWVNMYNLALGDSQGYNGTGSPARFDIDLGSPKRVGLIVANAVDRDRWFSFDVTGSNDGTSWSGSIGGITNFQAGQSGTPIDFLAVPITVSDALPYRYFRLTPNGNSTGETQRRGYGFGVFGPPTVAPAVTSNPFAAAATPTAVRLGAQIKRPNGANFSDLIGEVSRNNGASWSAVPLVLAGTQADGFELVEGLADISGQPAGQTMRYRLRSQNDAVIDIGGALLQWS